MSGKRAYEYRLLGGFRLFLAFLVIVQHFVANAAPVGLVYRTILPLEVGTLAVLVFFCISGFVITEAVARVYSTRPVAYLANRFLRIVPHYVVGVVIAVLVYGIFYHYGILRISNREHPDLPTPHAFDVQNIIGNLFGFLPGVNRLNSFDFIMIIWAVRIEMVFYFAVFAILLVPNRARLWAMAPVALSGLALATVFVAHQFGYGFFFLYGAMLYDHKRFKWSLPLSVCGMLLYYFILPAHPATTEAPFDRAVLPELLILTSLIGVMTWLVFQLSAKNRFDQKCGDLSYPLYIHHENVLVLVISLTVGYSWPVFLAGIVLSFLVSIALMKLVDPNINRVRDLIRGRRLS